MFPRRIVAAIAAAVLLCGSALAAEDLSKRPKMSKDTRWQVIRVLNAEFAFARRSFPIGEKGIELNEDGSWAIPEREVDNLVVQNGPAARKGDRLRITDVLIKDDEIRFEINGGPKKKKKWYERVQVSGMGGTTDLGANSTAELAKGSYLALKFKKHVPEMTVQEIKDRLAPVLDFTVKSAGEAYLESLPAVAQKAIKEKRVLVGMNREMVTMAKGRPPKKIREREEGKEFEEWIYGVPPQDVEFIRFQGEEVVQVKVMPVTGERVVRTARELDMRDAQAEQAKAAAAQPTAPAKRPSLRRPGEETPQEPGGITDPKVPPIADPNAGAEPRPKEPVTPDPPEVPR